MGLCFQFKADYDTNRVIQQNAQPTLFSKYSGYVKSLMWIFSLAIIVVGAIIFDLWSNIPSSCADHFEDKYPKMWLATVVFTFAYIFKLVTGILLLILLCCLFC